MRSKLIIALAALTVLTVTGLAVQPVLAQQQTSELEKLRQEVRRLEARVVRLEKETRPQLRPAG